MSEAGNFPNILPLSLHHVNDCRNGPLNTSCSTNP